MIAAVSYCHRALLLLLLLFGLVAVFGGCCFCGLLPSRVIVVATSVSSCRHALLLSLLRLALVIIVGLVLVLVAAAAAAFVVAAVVISLAWLSEKACQAHQETPQCPLGARSVPAQCPL